MNSRHENSNPCLEDIEMSRDLSRNEKQQFGFLVAWLESWRLPKRLPAGRETCRQFWKEMVMAKSRETWQISQWTQAIRWYWIPIGASKEPTVVFLRAC